MQKISLPQSPIYTEIGENIGRFEILGCYPGYGTTLGNALRRVLLSSLDGAAISSVKIKGVAHEFSTLSGVKEDMIRIILNLKKVRFKAHGKEDIFKATLKAKGEGEVTAKGIKCSSDFEVINKDQIIATLTEKKAEFEMELEISRGIGYVAVEQQERDEKEIGAIAIDAVYTPIRRVNYLVEDMRVGKRTDFNKIVLEIETDGSITPKEAFSKSVSVLVDQFSVFNEIKDGADEELDAVSEKEDFVIDSGTSEDEKSKKSEDFLIKKISELGFSSRVMNALEKGGVEKVGDIIRMTEEELGALEGMGDKGMKEIRKAIGEMGLVLKH